MPDTLYDADILAWSEQQAELLRRLARGERVNGVDWENVIEEVASVGRSETSAVESLLFQCLMHLAKAAGSSDPGLGNHWLAEALGHQQQARRRFSPSMRQKLDLPDLWERSRHLAMLRLGPREPIERIPPRLPLSLDDLLSANFDVAAILRTIVGAATAATA